MHFTSHGLGQIIELGYELLDSSPDFMPELYGSHLMTGNEWNWSDDITTCAGKQVSNRSASSSLYQVDLTTPYACNQ